MADHPVRSLIPAPGAGHAEPLRRLLSGLPGPMRRTIDRLLRPEARWIRIPIGVLMIVGGLAGLLPILGFWMLPVGLILLGEDIPPVRRITIRVIGAVRALWDRRHAGSRRRWATFRTSRHSCRRPTPTSRA